jgi:hypothetical protein
MTAHVDDIVKELIMDDDGTLIIVVRPWYERGVGAVVSDDPDVIAVAEQALDIEVIGIDTARGRFAERAS